MGILQTLATNTQNQEKLANEQKLESNKYFMFPKTELLRDNVLEAKQHWKNMEKYVNTQQCYNTIASRAELCDAFSNTLLGHAYQWFQTVHNDIINTYDLEIAFLKKFNKWGDTERDFTRAWNKLAFNADTHTVHGFAHEHDLLTAFIGATNAQIIDKFREAFPPEIESQLMDINDLEILIIKAHQLIQLFKPKQSTTGTVLAHTPSNLSAVSNIVPNNLNQKNPKAPIRYIWNIGHNKNTGNNRGPGHQRGYNTQGNRGNYKFQSSHDTYSNAQQ